MNPNKFPPCFMRNEFKCKCGHCRFEAVDVVLIDILQKIRNHCCSPIFITSGIRCITHNMKVGGAPDSMHTRGLAADFRCRNRSVQFIADFVNKNWPKTLGFGVYENKDFPFVHLDVRKKRTRWNDYD